MKHYRLVDWGTQGYLGVVGLLTLVFHNESVPVWGLLVAGHVVCMVAIHFLILQAARRPDQKVVGFFRAFYPIMLYTAFYRETELLNRMFIADYLDAVLIDVEARIFGCQPSLEFMKRFPQRWIAEILYAAYFSYYFMIVGVGLALFVRNRDHFHHFLTVVSLVFFACYLTYVFLPVTGPRVFYEEFRGIQIPPEIKAMAEGYPFPDSVTAGVFPSIILLIYRHLEAAGAAFPSSHVAVAVCTTWFSFLYLRRIRYPHAIVTILLCISTVYCRYHYIIDVIAGILMAGIMTPLAHYLYKRVEGDQKRVGNRTSAADP